MRKAWTKGVLQPKVQGAQAGGCALQRHVGSVLYVSSCRKRWATACGELVQREFPLPPGTSTSTDRVTVAGLEAVTELVSNWLLYWHCNEFWLLLEVWLLFLLWWFFFFFFSHLPTFRVLSISRLTAGGRCICLRPDTWWVDTFPFQNIQPGALCRY